MRVRTASGDARGVGDDDLYIGRHTVIDNI